MTTAPVLQIRGAVPSTPVELITGATTLTQVVLVVLALLSLLSWAIMLALWRELARAQGSSLRFFRDFERATRLEEAGTLAKVTAPNALTRLFMRAAHFVSQRVQLVVQAGEAGARDVEVAAEGAELVAVGHLDVLGEVAGGDPGQSSRAWDDHRVDRESGAGRRN